MHLSFFLVFRQEIKDKQLFYKSQVNPEMKQYLKNYPTSCKNITTAILLFGMLFYIVSTAICGSQALLHNGITTNSLNGKQIWKEAELGVVNHYLKNHTTIGCGFSWLGLDKIVNKKDKLLFGSSATLFYGNEILTATNTDHQQNHIQATRTIFSTSLFSQKTALIYYD